MIKLSICIATYNRAKFIAQTLDSILSQLTSNIELIVVDGASLDNTSEVLLDYSSKFSMIKYYQEKTNSGIDRDYDKALEYATGEYCWLMTDDDLMLPNAIASLHHFFAKKPDLIVVNSEIRNYDLKNILRPKFLEVSKDREYFDSDSQQFFSDIGNYLTFIGGVIIRREVWMQRNRSNYYGTLFIHVGVIFQNPPLTKMIVVSKPMISIRYGNAMWSARGFEIWMFKWPELIWSFDGFSEESKAFICPREPWRQIKNLLWYRAIGVYTRSEYLRFFENKDAMLRIISFSVSIFPASVLNTLASLYCLFTKKGQHTGVYDLSRSRTSTWISRTVARIFKV